jgi:hypothetical protein
VSVVPPARVRGSTVLASKTVVTLPSAWMRRMRCSRGSLTHRLPSLATATPLGWLKRAALPVPSRECAPPPSGAPAQSARVRSTPGCWAAGVGSPLPASPSPPEQAARHAASASVTAASGAVGPWNAFMADDLQKTRPSRTAAAWFLF